MLGHQERKALALLLVVSAVVIATHGALTLAGKHPFSRPFTAITPDGELVSLYGTIESAALTRAGGHVVLIVSNQTVFVPAPAAGGRAFQKGQNVSLYGIVTTYHGKKEITVSSAEDLCVV